MSDLTRLLGDVYGSTAETDVEDDLPSTALPDADGASPSWADEQTLDRAFADWVPGPPGDAPEAERRALTAEPAAPPAPSEWLFGEDTAPPVETLPEPVLPPPPVRSWTRSDDDLLAGRRGKPGRRARRSSPDWD